MKFWKTSLLTAILFFACSITVLYIACEKDPCTNVTCYNGGSCGNGICRCPTGYENVQCQDKVVTRFLGVYGGFITCNNGDEVIDSVSIFADTTNASTIDYVWVAWKAIAPKILHGQVQHNAADYVIAVPDELQTNHTKIYTITLQNSGLGMNNKLSVHSYTKDYSVTSDTVVTQCAFLGFKH